MTITKIIEGGSNNTLRWAIANGANIVEDTQLQSIINSETFYRIEVEDINFLELYRLVQLFREKVRIVASKPSEVPSKRELHELFPGGTVLDETKPDEKTPYVDIVDYAAQAFLNIAIQMQADDDIIKPEAAQLFIPMICRRFTVQIPLSFMDIVSGIQKQEDADKIFNSDYPTTLNTIITDEFSTVRNTLYIIMMKATSLVRYDPHYDELVEMIKFPGLRQSKTDELYSYKMLGFNRYDPIGRTQLMCNMFQANKEQIADTMKRMSRLATPVRVDFAVQLPIQYMKDILNSFDAHELEVSYEASIQSILNGGISLDNFITHGFDASEKSVNAIRSYEVRITDATNAMLNTLAILLKAEGDVDIPSIFALMPSAYKARAVFTLSSDKIDTYTSRMDGTSGALMKELSNLVTSVVGNINRSK